MWSSSMWLQLLCIPLALGVLPCAQASTTMWFNSSNIIPIGNGRLGAMMQGRVPIEDIVLNEDRIWSGHINDPNPTGCAPILPTVQDLIWKDDLATAQRMVDANCMANPLKQQVFQTAGNISIMTDHLDGITHFNHTLDLSTAVSATTYVHDGVQYTRTTFASHPDDVIVIRLTANISQAISFNLTFSTPMAMPVFHASGNFLSVSANGTTMYTLPGSIRYNATAQIHTEGGTITAVDTPGATQLSVIGADEALILVAIHTNYVRYDDITGNPEDLVAKTLAAVEGKSFNELLSTHIQDYSSLFGRVDISLGSPTEATYLPTNLRRVLKSGPDPDIFATYAQFGRYMGIASSRKTDPSNLQGIWNQETNPNWGSKHTININQQMNSWFAEPLNLAETLDPLWNLLQELAERGQDVAKTIYNIQRGWVAHHNTGVWRDSAPIDAAFYGFWPVAPAWMMQHLWEHFAFHPDPSSPFVKDVAYPMMKGLTEFFLDFLVEEPVTGMKYLVTNPSMSPEKGIGDYDGDNVSLTFGSTIDNSVLRDLFNHTAGFATMLGVDLDFAVNVTRTMERLMPLRIGSVGQIQEWGRDYPAGGAFTHISHMYPLFPSAQIDPRFNLTLATAANVSLTLRGDASNGWPTAWRANCFARLLDGEKALYYLNRLLSIYSYDNLWSRNSIFQIDGNFGGTNAVTEMILQSHNGEIHLLPAIPASWAEGSVTGFRARGGFELGIRWSEGTLLAAEITSTVGTFARVRYQGVAVDLTFARGQMRRLTPDDFRV